MTINSVPHIVRFRVFDHSSLKVRDVGVNSKLTLSKSENKETCN